MKVVHLSHSDISGGAARAAWRVHDSLRRAGADSSMFVAARDSSADDVVHYRPDPAMGRRIARIVRKERLRSAMKRATRTRPGGFEHFRDDREEFGPEVGRAAPAADVFNLHQITAFVDYGESLSRLAARAPLVWTLHEMTPMTGGCPYAYDCTGFTRTCGSCPQLGSTDPRDFSHQIWQRKKSVYSRIAAGRLHIVAPSRWMADEARRSSLLGGFPISVIPYGLDLENFRPRPEARRLLDVFGIKPTAKVVLFLADYTANRRKGFALLDEALERVGSSTEGVTLVSLGRDEPRLRSNLPHAHLGNFSDDRMISAIYSMADVFVIPSLQDNLPNTVLESMACGTPVVGFRVGGVPDMVRDGENGLLASPGDIAGLAAAIESILRDDAGRARMGEAARAIAEQEYTLSLQAERYLTLYRSLTPSI